MIFGEKQIFAIEVQDFSQNNRYAKFIVWIKNYPLGWIDGSTYLNLFNSFYDMVSNGNVHLYGLDWDAFYNKDYNIMDLYGLMKYENNFLSNGGFDIYSSFIFSDTNFFYFLYGLNYDLSDECERENPLYYTESLFFSKVAIEYVQNVFNDLIKHIEIIDSIHQFR